MNFGRIAKQWGVCIKILYTKYYLVFLKQEILFSLMLHNWVSNWVTSIKIKFSCGTKLNSCCKRYLTAARPQNLFLVSISSALTS